MSIDIKLKTQINQNIFFVHKLAKINVIKISTISRANCTFNTIPIKISMKLLVILKNLYRITKTQIISVILRRKNKLKASNF